MELYCAAVVVLQVCAVTVTSLAAIQNGGVNRQHLTQGEWAEWSTWTSCSTDCGSGLSMRSRSCQDPVMVVVAHLLSNSDDSVWCDGNATEIKVCNKNECQDGRKSFREKECDKYNASVHSGHQYTWEPFIHPSDPCKMTCRAKGHHFYANIAERVADGTPCRGVPSNPSAVCVQGVCKEVGCDDVLESTFRRDVCGVCKGDNSTCRTVSGIFARMDLERGATSIITIPAGSTNINITELRPSINHMALQTAQGNYFLNGETALSSLGEYQGAGTLFTYRSSGKNCPGKCIFALGPTDQSVQLMMLAKGRNPGILYSFNVPVTVTDSFFKKIIGHPDSSAEEDENGNILRAARIRDQSSKSIHSEARNDSSKSAISAKRDNEQLFHDGSSSESVTIESLRASEVDDKMVNEYFEQWETGEPFRNESYYQQSPRGSKSDDYDYGDDLNDKEPSKIGRVSNSGKSTSSITIPLDTPTEQNVKSKNSILHEQTTLKEDMREPTLSFDNDQPLHAATVVSLNSKGSETPLENKNDTHADSILPSTTDAGDDVGAPLPIILHLADNVHYGSETSIKSPTDSLATKHKTEIETTPKSAPLHSHNSVTTQSLQELVRTESTGLKHSDESSSQNVSTSASGHEDRESLSRQFSKNEPDMKQEHTNDDNTTVSSKTEPSHQHRQHQESHRQQIRGYQHQSHSSHVIQNNHVNESHHTNESHHVIQNHHSNETHHIIQNNHATESHHVNYSIQFGDFSAPRDVNVKIPEGDGAVTLPKEFWQVNGSSQRQQDSFTDSPTQDVRQDQSEASSRAAAEKKLFRHPNYSQSFIFKRRHKQVIEAENRGLIGDDSGSGYNARHPGRTDHPVALGADEQHGQDVRQQHLQSKHEVDSHQHNRSRQNPHDNNRHHFQSQTLAQSPTGNGQPHGQSNPVTEDRRSQVGSIHSQDRIVPVTDTDRRSTHDQIRGDSKRQHSGYDEHVRRQEEYRRELLRRRQLYEQQLASQQEEYNRRVQEHNRRVQERSRQQQEEQRRRYYERYHQNSDASRHNYQQHARQNYEQEQQRKQLELSGAHNIPGKTSGPTTHPSQHKSPSYPQHVAPYGGAISRVIPASRVYPHYRNTDGTNRQIGTNVQGSSKPENRNPQHVDSTNYYNSRGETSDVNQQTKDYFVGSELETRSANTVANTSVSEDQRRLENERHRAIHQHLTTPIPTPNHLTQPQQPIYPTVPSSIFSSPNIGRGIGPPQFVPPEQKHEGRSSLTAPSSAFSFPNSQSNQLPNDPDSLSLNGGDVIQNSYESPLVIGGSITSNEIESSSVAYEWRVSGLSECTLTCGGGVQQTVVVCLDTRTQAVVTDENCGHMHRPRAKAVTCSTRPCPAKWQPSEWSSCSVTCGEGHQTRNLACMTRISATLNLTMPDDNCEASPRPEVRRVCQSYACYTWRTGNWSKCSAQCGEGVRTREVRCTDQTGSDVRDDLCPRSQPSEEEVCDAGACGKGWLYTEWPQECPTRCGEGTLTRHVVCGGQEWGRLPDTRCDKHSRPESQRPCRTDTPCGGDWFTGEWEQCNVICGNGSKHRDVACIKSLPGGLLTVVGEENCAANLKPATEELCILPPCTAEWYMTSWSECSSTCDTGQRTREVRCLDSKQLPSGDCILADKPRTREPCNSISCEIRPTTGADCVDTFPRCELVRHARMCRYPYYSKKCCATCAENT